LNLEIYPSIKPSPQGAAFPTIKVGGRCKWGGLTIYLFYVILFPKEIKYEQESESKETEDT